MRSLRPRSVLAPCRSRVSVPLQLQKMLSMRWRIGARCSQGKRQIVKPVRAGTFSTSEVEFR